MERFVHLSVNWCFPASIGSFQGLPAELSEVILLSQRLALQYNTTPRDSCQHFLTSFFQFLCGGGLGAKLQPQRTLSGIAARCQLPREGSFWHDGKVSYCTCNFSDRVNGVRPLSQALSGLTALPKGEPRALPETSSLCLIL